MSAMLALTALLVRDYDEAITFFVDRLGFTLRSDDELGGGKRWVIVAPANGSAALLLAKAANDRQRALIGEQGGGRVWLFLHTDDFNRDHARMSAIGVRFLENPRREPYGTVAVFEDLYGNRWDLVEPVIAG